MNQLSPVMNSDGPQERKRRRGEEERRKMEEGGRDAEGRGNKKKDERLENRG